MCLYNYHNTHKSKILKIQTYWMVVTFTGRPLLVIMKKRQGRNNMICRQNLKEFLSKTNKCANVSYHHKKLLDLSKLLWTRKLLPGQVSQQVLDINLTKSQKKKKSWKFVYILAKQCKCPFNLTIFFDKKYQNSNFAQIWDFHQKLSIQNLLGHPV